MEMKMKMNCIKRNWFKIAFYCIWILNIISIFLNLDNMTFRFSLINFFVSIFMGCAWGLEFLLPKERRFKL